MAGIAQSKGHKAAREEAAQVSLPKWRIRAMLFITALIVAGIAARLVDVQVTQHKALADKARGEIDQQVTLQPRRGVITDRLSNVLAMDVDRESLWAIPELIPAERAPKLALTLSALLGKEVQPILEALTDREHYWTPIKRWLDPEVAAQIDALEEPGLRMVYEPRRVYPQGDTAAHVIGAVNFNGDGVSGVESFYNTTLKGVTGTLQAEFDPYKNPIAIAPQQRTPAQDGVNLRLTIDPLIQHLIETELRQAVEQHEADGGSIIVIDPNTGAIRGMASWPAFNPNDYNTYPEDVFYRNPAISDLYEPGSTFKVITVAAGLQSRAFTADTQVNDTGVIYRYGEPLRNWDGRANGMIDPGEVIRHSSNVGALQLNELTGAEQFYALVRGFGFDLPAGVDMDGDAQGLINFPGSPNYTDMTLLTNSYGQGIAVTPLQMVRAVAAIANDGVMMQPYIVEERCDREQCTRTEPIEVRQVIEPGVAWTIRRMLVNAANHYAPVVWGPRTRNYDDQWLVPGYQVCAKTGTSSIPLPGGGYDPSFTIGSVAGFAPAEDARYVVLVKIDRPKDDIWGVQTAIPVFYNIIEQLMRYERLAPDPGLLSPGQEIAR